MLRPSSMLCMNVLLGTLLSLSRVVFSFTPPSGVIILSSTSRASSSSVVVAAMSSTNDDTNNGKEQSKLSIAILGGGISGLSCASRLLSQHQQSYNDPSTSYELEVTVFDTGRLRPGGRCSSRLPGDVIVPTAPAVVKNKNNNNRGSSNGGGGGGGGGGKKKMYSYTAKANDDNTNDGRNNRRACDNDSNSNANDNNNKNNNAQELQVPDNIQKALNGAVPSSSSSSSRDRIINSMGPVDHAAQILSIPSSTKKNSSFDDFQSQLHQWLEEGTVESFPEGSVCELFNNEKDEAGKSSSSSSSKLQPLKGDMYYGKGGMGTIPIAMRDYCLSFNQFGENYTGQSFRILQDVWVSPSNGVKYIGNKDDEESIIDPSQQPQWELRAGKKSLGKYHRLVIAHNGKCADRIMSRTPAKAFHSLLRTKFAPYVPQWGGKEMTLNSIYSLVFAVKSEKGKSSDGGDGSSPIAKAFSKLSSSKDDNDVYTVMIKNEPSLRLLSCNTLKHHHRQNQNSESNIEVYTLLSSPKFGKNHKGPQENLPPELTQKVVMKMLKSLEHSLNLKDGSVVDSVVDLKLQLWGAAVPMNTWQSSSTNDNGADGFVYDATYGVGACGDWILDPSIAGAWESGRRLASWMITTSNQGGEDSSSNGSMSVGLPDRSSKESKNGKFVPSRIALGSGIGTIPSSPNSFSETPANEQSNRPGGPPRSKSPRQPPNGSRNNNGRRQNSNKKGNSRSTQQPVSQ